MAEVRGISSYGASRGKSPQGSPRVALPLGPAASPVPRSRKDDQTQAWSGFGCGYVRTKAGARGGRSGAWQQNEKNTDLHKMYVPAYFLWCAIAFAWVHNMGGCARFPTSLGMASVFLQADVAARATGLFCGAGCSHSVHDHRWRHLTNPSSIV